MPMRKIEVFSDFCVHCAGNVYSKFFRGLLMFARNYTLDTYFFIYRRIHTPCVWYPGSGPFVMAKPTAAPRAYLQNKQNIPRRFHRK